MTITVIALIVGLDKVGNSVNAELNDVAGAIGSVVQSFTYGGTASCCAAVPGSAFHDTRDKCDCE